MPNAMDCEHRGMGLTRTFALVRFKAVPERPVCATSGFEQS